MPSKKRRARENGVSKISSGKLVTKKNRSAIKPGLPVSIRPDRITLDETVHCHLCDRMVSGSWLAPHLLQLHGRVAYEHWFPDDTSVDPAIAINGESIHDVIGTEKTQKEQSAPPLAVTAYEPENHRLSARMPLLPESLHGSKNQARVNGHNAPCREGARLSTERSCPCGGSNENCYQCSGTGVIKPSDRARPTSTGTPKNRAAATFLIPRAIAEVPYGLFGHQKKKKSRRRERRDQFGSGPSRVRSASKQLVVCPQCGVSVRFDRLAKHRKKVHLGDSVLASSSRSGVDAKSESVTSRPKNNPNLGPHRQVLTTKLVKPDIRSSSDRRSARATLGDFMERSLDATKDSSWSSRERGRFGSHPSHDDHSDESKP